MAINQYAIASVHANIEVQITIGVKRQLNEQRQLNLGSQPKSKMIVLKVTVIIDVTKKLARLHIANLINMGMDYPVII